MSSYVSRQHIKFFEIEIIDIILFISEYSAVLGIVVFLIWIRKLNSLAGIVFLILLASFFADLLNTFYLNYVELNTYRISNVWYIVNYFLVIWLGFRMLSNHKRIISFLLITFVIGGLVSFYFYPLNESNTFIRVFSSITLIIIPLFFYLDLLKKPSGSLYKLPMFWISTSLFIYGCITLLKNLFTQLLVFDLEITANAFYGVAIVNLLANICKNLLLFYSLVLIRPNHDKRGLSIT